MLMVSAHAPGEKAQAVGLDLHRLHVDYMWKTTQMIIKLRNLNIAFILNSDHFVRIKKM